ncbi:bacillithiol biosynthesis cysteine-adding enzyme BshC [Yeosuana sp. MJ-SS3]|uniref:Putative cysteine ligase BshC n=1 Tax=Gilvirhabdus luticola TaxID=3079858 RepID=A0ABU3U591_9FLAO|nr:bacillithiol biosynthesis cysteine-adding enzyme BshC [Yeosuana sp. MJ-SS3]MDU8885531.1 bacillithiol biosynthesis cysteine-adding enzyme BshC [Yeosuana sp. MJ-SS3]
MHLDFIPFRNTNYFSNLICDYLDENEKLKQFYHRFPDIHNFKDQIEEKELNYPVDHREILVRKLKIQYANLSSSEATLQNIHLLSQENTFTITTGHQLNLFTGPLYFLYKIISTINLCKELNEKYSEFNFVPVYWMATEDHDFEEINYFNVNGKKIHWNRPAKGAVGELNTAGLKEVFNLLSLELGGSKNAKYLENLFNEAYLKNESLADATRFLANELFKGYGLVIIDANDTDLKRLFVPFIKEELLNNTSYNQVTKTNKELYKHSNIQVTPREINLFYLKENLRERITKENKSYLVNNTDIKFSEKEILTELNNHPERFSPNVIMRPLYQEVILPNLCYIGGAGELAYWFQLKKYFNEVNVTFPILLLRDSLLIQTQKQSKKLKKLNITTQDLFLKRDAFINKKVREISNVDIDFTPQKEHLQEQFKQLYELAKQTDKSFLGAVKAQERKQIKGLEHLEKRLLKAQKRKLADQVSRMTEIQNQLFPNQSLQERNTNFSELYLQYGELLIKQLIENINPLEMNFKVLTL